MMTAGIRPLKLAGGESKTGIGIVSLLEVKCRGRENEEAHRD
jgi:hypothetical protein